MQWMECSGWNEVGNANVSGALYIKKRCYVIRRVLYFFHSQAPQHEPRILLLGSNRLPFENRSGPVFHGQVASV